MQLSGSLPSMQVTGSRIFLVAKEKKTPPPQKKKQKNNVHITVLYHPPQRPVPRASCSLPESHYSSLLTRLILFCTLGLDCQPLLSLPN